VGDNEKRWLLEIVGGNKEAFCGKRIVLGGLLAPINARVHLILAPG